MEVLLHVVLAVALFYVINWIGERSSNLGYYQLTLFALRDDAPAFNFLLRALSPCVFIIVLSVGMYTAKFDGLTVGIWKLAIYYYAFRLLFTVALGHALLTNWLKFAAQAGIGTTAAYLAYEHLIVPRQPLFPDAQTIGNELWIAIALFLYATLNNLRTSHEPSARRRNRYLARRLSKLQHDYSKLVEGQFPERYMELVAYAVMIHEDFNRPSLVRRFERLLFPRWSRTLGIMQVRADKRVSDNESVQIGVSKLRSLFEETGRELGSVGDNRSHLINRTLAKYNRDQSYITEVTEVLHILWAQVATQYRPDFERFQYE